MAILVHRTDKQIVPASLRGGHGSAENLRRSSNGRVAAHAGIQNKGAWGGCEWSCKDVKIVEADMPLNNKPDPIRAGQ